MIEYTLQANHKVLVEYIWRFLDLGFNIPRGLKPSDSMTIVYEAESPDPEIIELFTELGEHTCITLLTSHSKFSRYKVWVNKC